MSNAIRAASVRFVRFWPGYSLKWLVRESCQIALLLPLLTGPAFCQNSNSGDIRGVVTDATGATIPEVAVTLLNVDTGVRKDLITNSSGVYDAVSIVPGKYQVTFSKSGFDKLIRSGIQLTANVITIDAQLQVGTAQQQVQVTAEASLLQTETAEQNTTMQAQAMQKLPNVGQDWANFTKVLPGAAGSGTGVAVNGNMPYYSNFLADGANVTLPHSANVDNMVFEDVAELQMSTSTFSAQYGVGGIVINQISKGGSNTWHGSGYEYLQNDFFNARDFFSASVPVQRYHNFGGSVSGPILKNKLFFFFNADKIISNGNTVFNNTYATEAMRSGDFSDPSFPIIYQPNTLGQGPGGSRVAYPGNRIPTNQLDPLALQFQSLIPLPNRPGFVNNWQGLLPSLSPHLRFFGRLDYDVSDKNRLTMSVTERDNPSYNPTPDFPLDTTTSDVGGYNAQISDVWTIRPNLVNEFRFGFTRQNNNFAGASLNQDFPTKLGWGYNFANDAPGLTISGTCCTTVQPGTNAIYDENSFDPSDVVTMIKGRHILKFGGEVLMYQDNSTPWGNINAGNFTFSGVFTQLAPNNSTNSLNETTGQSGIGYADFLLGQVDKWNASVTPIVGFRQKSPQVFVQDDWKITPRLTLNLGLRYQIQGGWSEVANRLGTFDPTLTNPATNTPGAIWFGGNNGRKNLQANDYKVFLPRVGFSWSPKNDWVLRGGFGIYAYGWSVDTYTNGAEGLGTNSQGSLTQTGQQNPVFILSQATYNNLNYKGPSHSADVYNGQAINYIPYHTPVARNYQYSFNIEHQFGSGMMLQLAYVGSHGTNLSFPVDYNQIPADKLMQSVALSNAGGDPQSLRPFPQFQAITGNLFNAISWYNSAQISFSKRMSYGLQFDVNYTWSRLLDEQDSSGWGSRDGGQFYQDSYNPRLNYGPSNFDLPHMFKGDLTYQIPFGKGRTFMNRGGIFDAILGGWQVSTLYVLESGRPFTVLVGTQNNSGSLGSNWYPNVIGDPSLAHPSVDLWYNPAAFAIPEAGTFGTAGRNILRAPATIGMDASLGKNFRIPLPHETGNLQLRFDASNILNHPNFEIPNQYIGTGAAGIINSTTNNYSTTNNTFGARALQLGARFTF